MDSYLVRFPFPILLEVGSATIPFVAPLRPFLFHPFEGYSVPNSFELFACCFAVRIGLVVWLVVSVAPILLQIDPTFKPTFQRLAFSQFNTIRTIHALFV